MTLEEIIILVIIGLIAFYLFTLIRTILNRVRRWLKFRSSYLATHVKDRAEANYNTIYTRYIRRYHKEPSHNEQFRMVINASHMTIRKKRFYGHWGRQKIRKYLLEKHNIVKKYKMK